MTYEEKLRGLQEGATNPERMGEGSFSDELGSDTPGKVPGGSTDSIAYPDDASRRQQALQRLGVTPQSMEEEQKAALIRQMLQRQQEQQGSAVMDQMQNDTEGFETSEQRQNRLLHLKQMLNKGQ